MRAAALGLAVLLSAHPPLHAAAASPSSAPTAFADWLMVQHRFREAELEYERLLVGSPHAEEAPKNAEKMFSAAWAAEDPAFVLALARAWSENSTIHCLSALQETRALYRLRNFPAARASQAGSECPLEIRDEQRYLSGLSLLRDRDWAPAQNVFARIVEPSRFSPQARAAASAALNGPRIHFLNPKLAAGLNAVLPGSGYAYARRPQTAAAAFTVTGLFTWGAVSAAGSGEKGLAALLSLFALGWYMGGVYGGARTASQENERRLNQFISPLELRF